MLLNSSFWYYLKFWKLTLALKLWVFSESLDETAVHGAAEGWDKGTWEENIPWAHWLVLHPFTGHFVNTYCVAEIIVTWAQSP